jgi:DNA-binding beta-propeller fold protein YncE
MWAVPPEHGVAGSLRDSVISRVRRVPLAGALIYSLALFTVSSAVHAEEPGIDPVFVVSAGKAGAPISAPRGVVIDTRRNEILLANTGMHRIELFDLKGTPLAFHVHRVKRLDGTLVDAQPSGVAVDRSGRLLVVDLLATYVDVLDFRGRSVGRLQLPSPDDDLARGNGPGVVMVGLDGTIYVGTRGDEGRVYSFSPDLKRLGVWGRSGSGAGRLSRITGMATAPDGNLIIACNGTDLAVQVFDAAGRFQFGFGRHEIGQGNFSFPSGVAVTGDGRIWVADEIRQMVQVFDGAGTYLGMVGGGGLMPGQFQYPSALASDGGSRLAIAERVGNRIQFLSAR